MIKLFVVGYPLDIQDSDLIEMFAIQGMVHSVQLITDKFTHKHKGFGFVEMVDQQGAERAIEALNGRVIAGRKITVKFADDKREEKPRSFKDNRFPTESTGATSRPGESFKSKRPRRLVSDK